ncbi:MAG: hypothetical protein Kow0098_21610 [Ignavibacteriaceae bacterium]
MKYRKIKIWHLVLATEIFIIVVRFDALINRLDLIINWFGLIFPGTEQALKYIDLAFLDMISEIILIIIVVPLLLIFRNKIKIFRLNLNFSNSFVILLLFTFLFTPLLSGWDPSFSKDLSVTKTLPPLSNVEMLIIDKGSTNSEIDAENFLRLKNSSLNPFFYKEIIFADSIRKKDKIIYYQNGIQNTLPVDADLSIENKTEITSKVFLLGTDQYGRDILSRLMYGTRTSVFIGTGAVVTALILGIVFGFAAGFAGGVWNLILSRLTDTFLAFPVIFFIVMILALFGNNFLSVILVLGLSGWMSLFKIVKGEVASLKQTDFIITSRQIGLSAQRILTQEIFPLIFAPVAVNTVFLFGNVVLAEAALSYLGLGAGIDNYSWGAMIDAGQQYISKAWWMSLFPGLLLVFTLISVNNLGRMIQSSYNPRILR